MIQLRDYQQKGIDDLRQSLRYHKSVILCMPTGAGKTALASVMAGNAAKRGLKCMFLVHRRELIKQTEEAFGLAGIHYGLIQAGAKGLDLMAPVQIGSIQTVGRRLHKLTRPDLLIVDECHHARAKTWAAVIDWADCKMVGLTATPCRLDGKGLKTHFDDIIIGPSTRELIDQGHLSPFRIFAPTTVSLEGIKTLGGDYRRDQLAKLMDKGTIIGDAVKHYLKYAAGKTAVVFAVSIDHAEHLAGAFNENGISAEYIYGDMAHGKRDELIKRFRSGETKVLTNVDIIGEGFDLPSIHCSILQRPTKSLSLHLQQIGRCLRPQEGKKEAIILDHVGNTSRLGLPDEPRDWTLDGVVKQNKTSDEPKVQVKQCPECFRVVFSDVVQCDCGYIWEVQSREINEVDGELQEIDLHSEKHQQKKMNRQMQGQAQSYEDLVQVGLGRGYKHARAWARHVYDARQARMEVV